MSRLSYPICIFNHWNIRKVWDPLIDEFSTTVLPQEERIAMAQHFFNLIYPYDNEGNYTYLWGKKNKQNVTVPFPLNEHKAMAERAITLSDEGYDVYFGICTTDHTISESKRAKSSEVIGRTVVWADIDIQNSAAHSKTSLPPDLTTAQTFFPIQPSLVIHSGYGIHSYWILNEMYAITDDNREDMTTLNKDFLNTIRANAGAYSNGIDAVHDLARILRVPGTFNYKLESENPPLCQIIEENEVVYTLTEIRNSIPTQPDTHNELTALTLSLDVSNVDDQSYDDSDDFRIIDKIRESKQGYAFARLFDDGDISKYHNDHSAADMALMNMLTFWTNGNREQMERIFDMSALANRDKWIQRADYRQNTINKALEFWNGVSYKDPNIIIHDGDIAELLAKYDNGKIKRTVDNFVTILEADPEYFGLIAQDTFSGKIIKTRQPSWGDFYDIGKAWTDSDDVQLRYSIDLKYELRQPQFLGEAIAIVASHNAIHPVRNYLDNLPSWDGVHRAEKLFIDTLGVPDNEYARCITLCWLKAAIRRVRIPGCKFDYCLVLAGSQGIGKTTILSKLGGKWFNNSIDNINGKDALEQLQGSWIIELGEMQATRKAENEAIKSFISRTTDKVRLPYAKRAEEFPRQCVFSATTNDDQPLRDKTGSRRFWILKSVSDASSTKDRLSILTNEYVQQVWAEVNSIYFREQQETGYVNVLPPSDILDEARRLQEEFTEGSELNAQIQQYLDIKLPAVWSQLDKYVRYRFIQDCFQGKSSISIDGLNLNGTESRDEVCSSEIAYELFQIANPYMNKMILREINTIMSNLEGWHKESKSHRMGIYGIQRTYYVRDTQSSQERGNHVRRGMFTCLSTP